MGVRVGVGWDSFDSAARVSCGKFTLCFKAFVSIFKNEGKKIINTLKTPPPNSCWPRKLQPKDLRQAKPSVAVEQLNRDFASRSTKSEALLRRASMELAVVSNGWGIRDFVVFNSDPFRLCVCVWCVSARIQSASSCYLI